MDARLMMITQDYLAGEKSLDRLQNVLMDITWDGVTEVAPETMSLAQLIELRIAEYTGHHISEQQLKALIAEAIGPSPTYVLSAGEHQAQARMGPRFRSSARTQRRTMAFS